MNLNASDKFGGLGTWGGASFFNYFHSKIYQ